MRMALQRRISGCGAPRRITVRRSPREPLQAVIRFGPLTFRGALGRGGISAFKREGDGVTPRAAMAVMGGFQRGTEPGRRSFIAASRVPLDRAGPRDGWCDQPGHAAYNRPVQLPFPASCERLVRDDGLYDAVLVLDWNLRSRARGRGSAIFLHVAREGYQPTEGCVALKPRDLRLLLAFLRPGDLVDVL